MSYGHNESQWVKTSNLCFKKEYSSLAYSKLSDPCNDSKQAEGDIVEVKTKRQNVFQATNISLFSSRKSKNSAFSCDRRDFTRFSHLMILERPTPYPVRNAACS